MSRLMSLAALLAAVLLSACASKPQQPVPLNDAAVRAADARIGVIMAPLPKPDTYFPGADCLLCYATASAVNSKLTAQVRTLGTEDLADLKRLLTEAVVRRGGQAVPLSGDVKPDDLASTRDEAPNRAPRDFRPLAATYPVDRLLVVEIRQVGFLRPYAAYVSTDAPRAVVRGSAYLVNLKTNLYEWFQPIDIAKGSTTWDQPPGYPDLTNAYFQAVELAKDAALKAWR
ncbi:hypothetical protein ABXN37_05790 [Piscinibacter sakaiensis]|uniref:Lipoprotein n=1 Tax=Piscinibacter sakaiensis TaxID=1547922 RepID=A0A0K8NWB4_PISS1|nr:hypothetical protein [Piscinibacter sakaiensis]GAP34658.1 hypothetical protein ISF6_5366 [Piscinibacter sakaiensis]